MGTLSCITKLISLIVDFLDHLLLKIIIKVNLLSKRKGINIWQRFSYGNDFNLRVFGFFGDCSSTNALLINLIIEIYYFSLSLNMIYFDSFKGRLIFKMFTCTPNSFVTQFNDFLKDNLLIIRINFINRLFFFKFLISTITPF